MAGDLEQGLTLVRIEAREREGPGAGGGGGQPDPRGQHGRPRRGAAGEVQEPSPVHGS